MIRLEQKEDARIVTSCFTFLKLENLHRVFEEKRKDLIITFTNRMNEKKICQNQKFHKKDHILCKLKLERNIMYACAENPKISHCVTVLMRAQALDQEFSKLPKQDSSRFADANTAKMKPESVTELTAHYS